MKRFLYLILFVPCIASAEVVETWSCTERYGSDQVIVTSLVNNGRETGQIKVAGITYETAFRIIGFNRRWDFVSNSDSYNYAFVIEPNGAAAYYDFNKAKSVMPSLLMTCEVETESEIKTKIEHETDDEEY